MAFAEAEVGVGLIFEAYCVVQTGGGVGIKTYGRQPNKWFRHS